MNTLLAPIIYIISTIFTFSLDISKSPGFSVLILSLAVTLMLVPIQLLIDWNKKRVAPIKERMKAVEDEIERCYSGQTKHLYLKTLYRQHGYHPINNFISLAVPLFQIPFFLAAYGFLTGVQAFQGTPFLFINDLLLPDQLIPFGGLALNLLPIVMTLINLLNVELVTDEKKSEKIMLRFMGLFFLLALYNMPSGLVLYWTMNNAFLLLLGIRVQEKRNALLHFLKGCVLKAKSIPLLLSYTSELAFVFLSLAGYCFLLRLLNPTPGSLGYYLATWSSVLSLLMAIPFLFKATKRFAGIKSKFDLEAYWPLLGLCCVPVFHYMYGNAVFLTPKYLAELVIYLLVPAGVLLFVIRVLLKKDFYLLFGGALVLTFFLTPIWLYFFKVRIEEGFGFQLLLLGVTAFVLIKLYSGQPRFFINLALCLFLISLGRLSASLARRFVLNRGIEIEKVPSYFPRNVNKKPDIFFLIYDAYVDEQFSKHIGLDNSAQLTFLKEKGFKIYKEKLSLERSSLYSLSLLYNLGKKVDSKKTRFVLSGHNPIDKFAKDQGYDTYYMAKDYFFRGVKESTKANILIPQKPRNTLLDGILQGEFKFETISKGFDYEIWKELKRDLFKKKTEKPKWVYAHSPYPAHSQFSGMCLPDELERYKARLKLANEEMREDIRNILETNPNSIIITAGDHGAYLLGDCATMKDYKASQIKGEHILDRFGIHMAIRWPEKGIEKFDHFHYLQGTFHSVIAYMANDSSILEHQPEGKVCIKGVCGSRNEPLNKGPDAGKMLFNSL